MIQQSTAKELCDLGIGRGLSDASLRRLAELSVIERFACGERVFREGQKHSQIHWVQSGRIALEMTGGTKLPMPLLTIGKGEVLAWSSFVGNQRMTATATAVIESSLITFDTAVLLGLCEQDYEIGYRLMRHVAIGLSNRLLVTRLQLMDLFGHPDRSTT